MGAEISGADNQHLGKSPAVEEVNMIISELGTVRTCINWFLCFGLFVGTVVVGVLTMGMIQLFYPSALRKSCV